MSRGGRGAAWVVRGEGRTSPVTPHHEAVAATQARGRDGE